MEEDKAAAYYDELTRKGEGAARFKLGLGFSSSSSPTPNDVVPSFLTTFVKASSPSATCHKQSHLHSIQSKLSVKKQSSSLDTRSDNRHSFRDSHRDSIRDKDRDNDRFRHSIRDRDRDSGSDGDCRHRSSIRDRERRRRRSGSPRSDSDRRKRRSGSRSDSDVERRRRRRNARRSVSPGDRRNTEKRGEEGSKGRKGDYAKLIHGYHKMSPAERVKAKMKFQLSETAEKDAKNGMGSGWERFDFDKDAPLDDQEMEVADDDVALVKHIGQSFRFSTVEANRVDQIKAAHDEAMFGSSSALPSIHTEDVIEQEIEIKKESAPATSLLSDKVITGQGGSWRDRARKA